MGNKLQYLHNLSQYANKGEQKISDYRLAYNLHSHVDNRTTLLCVDIEGESYELALCSTIRIADRRGEDPILLSGDAITKKMLSDLESPESLFWVEGGDMELEDSPWFEWVTKMVMLLVMFSIHSHWIPRLPLPH